MEPLNSIYTEKYRPKHVKDIVGSFKNKILKYLDNPKAIPHFLFYSKTPGTGKCLGRNTPILMFDRTIKKVQDIKYNDILIGPDKKERYARGLTKGISKLYKVKQDIGDDYIVNAAHILSLYNNKTNKVININVEKYILKSDIDKNNLKGYKVNFDGINKNWYDNIDYYNITVIDIGVDKFYGFTVGADGLFVLGDYTVTHNTTLAKAIINDLGCDHIIINSSDDRKIETIREKVKQFAVTKSSKKDLKRCVFLDEADGMWGSARGSQEALRNIMETYSSNCFFLLTCNNINKVILPLQSRCKIIQFAYPDKPEIYKYLEKICIAEEMEYSEDGINTLINHNYPSIRNCVITLQDLNTEGQPVTPEYVKPATEELDRLWELLQKKDWKTIKTKIMESTIDPREVNTHFWLKALRNDPPLIKIIQMTCRNEKDIAWGADPRIVFVSSLIELVR